jgi:hypothetical protein
MQHIWTGANARGEYAVTPWTPSSCNNGAGCGGSRGMSSGNVGASAGLLGLGGFSGLTGPLTGPATVASLSCDRVLERYSTTSDDLYRHRAASNGRSVAWKPLQVLAAPNLSPLLGRLHAVWMTEGLASVVVGSFDEFTGTWATTASALSCAEPLTPELSCPNLSPDIDGSMYVAWLETGLAANAYSVCGTNIDALLDFSGSPRDVAWDLGPLPSDRSARYLSTAAGPGGAALALTEALNNSGEEARGYDVSWGEVSSSMVYFDLYGPDPTDRTSDPSVATSPDGSITVYVWEEYPDTPYIPGVPPGQHLMFLVINRNALEAETGRPLVQGPFRVRRESRLAVNTGVEVQGGDPSVAVTDQAIYVAHQGPGGGAYLLRTPRSALLQGLASGTVLWEPVLASLGGLSEDGYIGPGWFPNVSARTMSDGDDLVAVVWEHSEALTFMDNETKHIELAFVHSEFSGSAGFWISGTRSLSNASVDASILRFQLAPGVVIGPDDIGLGYVPVDVLWMDVNVDPTAEVAYLKHRRYSFDGMCVTW